jgi:hypothetical protein
MLEPRRREIEVRMAGQKTSQRLVFDGKPLEIKLSEVNPFPRGGVLLDGLR